MLVPFVILAVFLVVLLFVLGVRRKKYAKKDIHFGYLKEQYKFDLYKQNSGAFGPKVFSLKGSFEGTDVEVKEQVKRSYRNSVCYTHITLPAHFDFEFLIGKENFISLMWRAVGFKDIEFNDHQLDREYLFKSNNEEAFRELINHDILNELNRIGSIFKGQLECKDGELTYSFRGEIISEEVRQNVEELLSFMIKILSR